MQFISKYLYLLLVSGLLFCDLLSASTHGRPHKKSTSPDTRSSWSLLDGTFYSKCTDGHQDALLKALRDRPYTSLFIGQKSDGSASENNGVISFVDPSHHFSLVRQLGRGGFGMVYETTDKSGKRWATKLIPVMCDMNGHFYPVAFGGDNIAIKSLRSAISEILCLALCNHVVIPKLHSAVLYKSTFFITEEFVGGDIPLSSTLGKDVLRGSIDLVRKIGYQLLDAIEHLHKLGIIHRDIKPGNIKVEWIELTGGIKTHLLDFGIAAFEGQATQEPYCTPRYAPPKTFPPSLASSAYDIYSLGVTLWEIFMQKAFEGDISEIILYDEDFYNLLEGMLESNPSKRLTASACKAHEFFSSITDDFKKELVIQEDNADKSSNTKQTARHVLGELGNAKSEKSKVDSDEEHESEEEDRRPKKRLRKNTDGESGESEPHSVTLKIPTPVTPEKGKGPTPHSSPQRQTHVHPMYFPKGVITPLRPTNRGSAITTGESTTVYESPFKGARQKIRDANIHAFIPFALTVGSSSDD